MNIPLNCPFCNERLLYKYNTSLSLELKYHYSTCSCSNRFSIDYENDLCFISKIEFYIKSDIYIVFDTNNAVSIYNNYNGDSITIPYFKPDLNNISNTISKLNTFLLFI